jgi:hypothetical protein
LKPLRAVHDPAADYSREHPDFSYLSQGNFEGIAIKHNQIRHLSFTNRSSQLLFMGCVCRFLCEQFDRSLSADTLSVVARCGSHCG